MLARAASIVSLAAIVVSSAVGVVLFVREGADVPNDDDVIAAARAVAAFKVTDDDVVLVAPPWSMQPQRAASAIGAPALAARMVPADGPWDVLHHRRHRRVVLWREADAEPWLTRSHPVTEALAQAYGNVHVAIVDDAIAPFDALRAFDAATVRLGDDIVCAAGRPRDARCQRGQARAAREWGLVTENAQEAIVLAAPADGVVSVTYNDVAFGDTLIVAAGHTRRALERHLRQRQKDAGKDGSVVVEVRAGDVVLHSRALQPAFRVEPHRADNVARFVRDRNNDADGARGFIAAVVDTGALAGTRGPLTVAARARSDGMEVGVDAFVPAASRGGR